MRTAAAVTLCLVTVAGCRRAAHAPPDPDRLLARAFEVPEGQELPSPASPPSATPEVARDIDQQIASLVTRFGVGGAPLAPTTYGRLSAAAAQHYAVPAHAGRCYRVFLVADRGAADVDAQLREVPGAPVVEGDESYGTVAMLGFRNSICPTHDLVYQLSVRALYHDASFGLVVMNFDGVPDPSMGYGGIRRHYIR